MAFMEKEVFKGDGWAIETDDGTVYAPDLDAPDADDLRAQIGTGKRVQVGDVYGRIEAVTYLKGWWGRYSAPGYLDATPWVYATTKKEVEEELKFYGGDDDENPKRRRRRRRNPRFTRKEERQYKHILSGGARRRYGKRAKSVAAATVLKGRRRRRRRNPLKPYDRGRKFGVKLTALHVRYFQGYAEDVRYLRAEDNKPYSHVVESGAAELYLCEDSTYGKCLLIVDPSGKTPLWG